MKAVQKILFIFAMTIGLSAAVLAQKNDDQKKPPPKPPPPVVNPGKPPKDDKHNRPGMAFVIARKESLGDLA